jgi:catechol 2,3-dioxygenase-like lactoylglutathione lyase family enzyme
MALTGLELHHHGIRIDPDVADESLAFYRDVLGLDADPARPDNPAFRGAWLDLANDTQIHLMGVKAGELSPFAADADHDPARPHVALGVPDLAAAVAELDRLGVAHWSLGNGPVAQVFMADPSGNAIELHEIGTCRCKHTTRL